MTLVKSAEGDAIKLEQLQNHVNELKRGVETRAISTVARDQLKQLLSLSEETCQIIAQRRILNALAYADMHRRFDDVETAHYKTFRWIFKTSTLPKEGSTEGHKFHDVSDSAEETDDSASEEYDYDIEDDGSNEDDGSAGDDGNTQVRGSGNDRHDTSISESFLHWLSTGNDIFHITGKLGSGKSTLMKFLCEHKRTKEELQKWAGES